MKSPSVGLVGILLAAVCGSVAATEPLSDVRKEEPISESQFAPWGNLQGMRVWAEWVAFEAGVRVVRSDWSGFSGAVKYLQRPQYSRAGNQRTVVSSIGGVGFRNVLTDTAPGEATFEVEVVAETELEAAGVFLCLDLPGEGFAEATVQVFDSSADSGTTLTVASGPEARGVTGRRIRIAGGGHRLDLEVADPVEVRLRRDLFNRATALNDPRVDQSFEQPVPGEKNDWQLYLRLLDGATPTGSRAAMRIDLKATAAIDPAPVRLTLDATKPGRRFDGIGGNFRLQFPKTDPAVIRYCLENLPVTWGRNDLPWAEWHPVEEEDPLALARSGKVDPRVSAAMDMARTLEKRGIPMIVSVWSVPRWARADHQPPGLRGIALHEGKSPAIVASLAKALVFLKERYGVEAAFFSLNEPETGVEVRQTAIEHREFMLEMGRELAKHNLATRMLLGDTAHGTPAALNFILPSLEDPRLRGYVGAVAFHTWRGCTPADLLRWSGAVRDLGVPLLVTESGPDAHLHNYHGVRLEPWFQLQEIELYVRICNLAQPLVIMPWQLTTDYSVLKGGGVYSEAGPLDPTQRFWNLKQLGLTPPRAFALPLTSDQPEVTSAAFGDLAHGALALHLVNTGGPRVALVDGLPAGIRRARLLVTDARRGMAELGEVSVEGGTVEFMLPAASYVTLLAEPEARADSTLS